MRWTDGLLADLGLALPETTGQQASTGTFPDGAAHGDQVRGGLAQSKPGAAGLGVPVP